MNALKKLIASLLAIVVTLTVAAQDLLTFVPADAAYVGMANLEQINTKGHFAELINLPFLQKMDREIAKDFSRDLVSADSSNYLDLTKYGFDVKGKTYSYFVGRDKMYYGAALFSIADKNKFTEFVKLFTRDKEGEKIIVTDNYSQSGSRDLHIVWNNSVAAIFGVSMSRAYKDTIEAEIRRKYNIEDPYYSYFKNYEEEAVEEIPADEAIVEQDEVTVTEPSEENNDTIISEDLSNQKDYVDIYTLKYAAFDSITNEWIYHNTASFIESKGANSYVGNSYFQEYLKSQPDAALVIDYGLLSNMFMTPMLGAFPRSVWDKSTYGFLNSFYKGMTMYAKLDMQKDAVELSIDTKYSSEINMVLDKIKKKKISKDFFKYMNKDMMGYYAVGLDIEGVSEGLKDMLRKTLPQIPEYGKAAVNGMDLIDILIDEKAIYNIFTGDAVLAVNGVKEIEVIRKTYEFDDDFNRIDIIDTSMQKMPDILFMAGIGNKTDIQKLADLLVNLKIFKKEGNLYSIDVKRNKIPVHFQILDNILFIGNNKSTVANPLVASDKQLKGDHKKMFKKNTFVGYVNVAGITRSLADFDLSQKKQQSLVETSNLFKEIKMQGYKKGNMMHGKYTIQLKESKYNSIEDILRFINNMYLINDKRI